MRKYLTEFIGTFIFISIIALTGNPFIIAAVLTLVIYFGVDLSGACYNPAVTYANMISGDVNFKSAVLYILCEIAGGTLATVVTGLITHKAFTPINTIKTSIPEVIITELFLTYVFVFIICTASDYKKKNNNKLFGVVIGISLFAIAFAGSNISGGLYNPAIVIGSAIGNFPHIPSFINLLIYTFSPFFGALLAVFMFKTVTKE